jgi:hypothetical protein
MTFIFIAREQRLTDKCAKQSCAEQLNARVRATTQFQSRLCGQINAILINGDTHRSVDARLLATLHAYPS